MSQLYLGSGKVRPYTVQYVRPHRLATSPTYMYYDADLLIAALYMYMLVVQRAYNSGRLAVRAVTVGVMILNLNPR